MKQIRKILSESIAEVDFLNQPVERLFYTPRRIFAILPSIKQANFIARRVSKVGFSPGPVLIGGFLFEVQAAFLQLPDFGVEVFALEI
jgi:hypothetical protein